MSDDDKDAQNAHDAHLLRDELPGATGDDEEPSPPFRGWCKSIDESEWSAAWACYRDGTRGIRALARKCSFGFSMAKTCIERGFPNQGLASFQDKLKLWERQREAARARELEADRQAAADQGMTEARIWRDFTKRTQSLVKQAEDVLVSFGKKLQAHAPLVSFVRYRRVRQAVTVAVKDGHEVQEIRVVDQPYVDGAAFAKALALWAGAAKDIPGLMRMMLGPSALQPEAVVPEFTAEQLEKMARGELPEGISPRDVGLALIAAAAGGREP